MQTGYLINVCKSTRYMKPTICLAVPLRIKMSRDQIEHS